ncbi:hypothetical protein Tco_0528018 [Tanacetum coccineum]
MNKLHPKPQAENGSTWNLSLKQESLDWNAIELSLKMLHSSITWSSKNLIAASMVKSPENARFSMKLRKLIAEHPEQVSSIIRLLKKRDLRWRWKVGCEGGCEKSGCLMIGGGGDDGCGRLVGFLRGVFGDNERVISNEGMLWIVFDGALGSTRKELEMGGKKCVVFTSSSL